MAHPTHCPVCGAERPSDTPDQPCPACLMKLGLESWQSRAASPSDAPPTVLSPGAFVPPAAEEIARKFPQLEITELLGHGGMGAVYKARQKRLDRTVALKIIKPDAAGDPGFAERFAREARTLARLSHPNIVTVHDFGEIRGEPPERVAADQDASKSSEPPRDRPNAGTTHPLFYFIMEYVEGVNLRQLLEQGRLDPRQALQIVPHVCDALQYAHDEGVVHRDIKPENILIDSKGRVKIADFGLAKLVRGPADDISLTGTHQIMGTPRYMAPEQMEGSRAVDHRSDIYSLGVVFYEMLTGELPIGRFEPPSSKVHVDVRLDEVVLRTLERQPERRYQQASAVRTDLERITASAAARAMPAGTGNLREAAVAGRGAEVRAARQILRGLAWLLLFVNLTALVLSVATAETEALPFRVSSRQIPLEHELKKLVWHSLVPYIISPYVLIPLATLALSVGVYLFAANYLKARHGPLVDADDADSVRREVGGPARGLVVTGVANWIALPLVILVTAEQIPPEPMAILAALAFVVAGLLISAGLRMQRLRGWRMAVAASIVAMFVTPGNIIGLPIGIWSLVVLCQPEVREAFRRRTRERSLQAGGGAADDDATRAGTTPGDGALAADPDAAGRQLRGPAAGLLLAGVATVLTSAAVVAWTGTTLVRIASSPDAPQTTISGVPGNQTTVTVHPHALRPHRGKYQALLAPHVLGLAAGVLMVVAGLMMGRAESYDLVRAASLLAVLPLWVAWPVALPAGIWALSVLARPGIRQAFERVAAGDAALTEALARRFRPVGRFAPRTVWAVGVCLLGSAAAFVPWTRLSIAGTSTHLLGIDTWHGVVSGVAFLIALHGLLAIDLFGLARGSRVVVMFLTAAVVATACGFHFESVARGFEVSDRQFSGTGGAELMKGFERMVESLLSQMWRVRPHLGGYLSAGLAGVLVILGVLSLRELRRTPTEARTDADASPSHPHGPSTTPVAESAGT